MMTGSMDLLLGEMIAHNAGDPKRIQHLVKVHAFARYIARKEGLAGEELETLEVAAYVHDIGIRLAEDRYGYSSSRRSWALPPQRRCLPVWDSRRIRSAGRPGW